MDITGVITALVIGIIIGALARLVLPGRQNIGFLLTLLVGVLGALLGTFVAGLLDVAVTGGVDWIEIAMQIAFAAVGVILVDRVRGGRAVSR